MLLAAAALAGMASRSFAAKIGLSPLMGDGASGRTTLLTGTFFEPSTAYNIAVGGFPTVPATTTSSAAGTVYETLTLPDLPRGNLDVVLASATLSRTFTGAYRVWPNLSLVPTAGEGRAGQTWQTNGAIPTGGWTGMVLVVKGTGFASGFTIPADSITVGGVATSHPAITVSAAGRFQSATLIVTSNLAAGLKDLVINDGAAQTYAGVYEVRRSIALSPARGFGAAGTTVFIEGWGFTDGTLSANSITIGAAVTTHPAAAITDGAWSTTLTLNGDPGGGPQAVGTSQETFTGCFDDAGSASRQTAIYPDVPSAPPNYAVQVRGLGNWGTGTIAANTSLFRTPGPDLPTSHAAIPVANGRFGPAWIVSTGPLELRTNALAIQDPVTLGLQNSSAIYVKRTVAVDPILGTGAAGFTVTLTGFGFNQNYTFGAGDITVGGFTPTYPTTAINPVGYFKTNLILPTLPDGQLTTTIFDNRGTVGFLNPVAARRTAGLSFVLGAGFAGDRTDLVGTGFAPGTIGADSVTFGGIPTTHAAITVGANGSFAPTALTLPALAAGPYDVVAQGGEAFPAAYRVYAPRLAVGKFISPPSGAAGITVTYTLSYTNATYVADQRVQNVVLHDTIPAGMTYVAGSAASTLPAVIDFFHPSCPCFNAVQTPVTDVTRIRWTLSSPLPVGASGYASFQATVD